MRFFIVFLLLLRISLYADDEPDYEDIITHVSDESIPSLVNLTSLPSSMVAGCVNAITGDLCIHGTDDEVTGP